MRPTSGTVIQLEKDKPRNRCRKWELRANFGCVDGKYPKKTKRFEGAWREANAALAQWIAELELEDERASDPLLADYLMVWHARREASRAYAYKTMKNEASRIRRMSGDIGDVRLSQLDSHKVEELYDTWRAKYAPSTASICATTFVTCVKDAVKSGLVEPSALDARNRPHAGRSAHDVLDDAQMDALVGTLDPDDGRQLAIMLMVGCGLRCSEAVALEWRDWDGESLHVERADAGDGSVKSPKTPAGVRSVPAPRWLAPVLDERKGDGRICAVNVNQVGGWWAHHRGRLGVSCTLHELRHSYLTRLARHGVHPRVMMQLAGHDTISVCMEIYSHVSDDMQRKAVDAAFS